MLDAVVDAGARLEWKSWGVAATLAQDGRPRQVVQISPKHVYMVVSAPSCLPEEQFTAAAQRLEEAGVGSRGEKGYYWIVRIADATTQQLAVVGEAVVTLCSQLARSGSP